MTRIPTLTAKLQTGGLSKTLIGRFLRFITMEYASDYEHSQTFVQNFRSLLDAVSCVSFEFLLNNQLLKSINQLEETLKIVKGQRKEIEQDLQRLVIAVRLLFEKKKIYIHNTKSSTLLFTLVFVPNLQSNFQMTVKSNAIAELRY